ncbi:MAG: metallopeptidase family protein [Polyangiaceae bacterium]
MARSLPALPSALTLPSGLRVRFGDVGKREPRDREAPPRTQVASALALCEGRLFDAGSGAPVDAWDLSLGDVHVLTAVLARSGLVAETPTRIACENCGAPLEVAPSEHVELGPFLDGELADPELDAPFDFARTHRIPATITPSGLARTARLAPRSAREAKLLVDATSSVALSPALVTALGIVALGKERRAQAIARALARAGDRVWTELGHLWERAHYSPRLFAQVFCACGARNELLAPADRELDRIAPELPTEREGAPAGFPSDAEFDRLVEDARARVFAARGVAGVDVIVDGGVPDCDDGGVPLLGSYLPTTPGLAPGEDGPPEIRLYVRSFQSEFRLDSSFDVAREIEETLDHEVEHHLHFLAGYDPMDEEERAVIARDRERVIGKSELARRSTRAAMSDLTSFLTRAGPLLLVIAIAFYLQFCRS